MKDKSKREVLRHTLATLAYRGGKAIKDAPEKFADFKASEFTMRPCAVKIIFGRKSKQGASEKNNRQTVSSSIES